MNTLILRTAWSSVSEWVSNRCWPVLPTPPCTPEVLAAWPGTGGQAALCTIEVHGVGLLLVIGRESSLHPRSITTTLIKDAGGRNAAVMDAFVELYAWASEQSGPVHTIVCYPVLQRELPSMAQHLPALDLRTALEAGPLYRATVRKLQRERNRLVKQRKRPPVVDRRVGRTVVATDASRSPDEPGLGIAWVNSLGHRDSQALADGPVIVGELEAIRLAAGAHREAHLLSDSHDAVTWLNGRRLAPIEYAQTVAELREMFAARGLTIAWVKAHQGHRLNEAADQLARRARRLCVAA